MNFIREMKIGTRLAASFTLLLVLMAGIASIGMYFNERMSERIRVVYQDRVLPVQQLSSIDDRIQRNRVLVMGMLISPDRSTVEKHSAEFARNRAFIDQTWKAFLALPQTPVESSLIRTVQQRLDGYFSEGLNPVNQAMIDDQYDEAADLYLRKLVPLEPPVREVMDRLIQLKIEQSQQEFEDSMQAKQIVNGIMAVVALLALATGALLSWVITRSITAPIADAVRVANMVAGGDLSVAIEVKGQDETANMLAALKTMHDNLHEIVLQVRHGSETIALGSKEIATGSAALAQRTEEQAANLEQTSAAMVEITEMVNHNADTALQASKLAHAASGSAIQGGQVVAQVVETMEQISQSSRQISDITSIIDSIAFQTNILALNAAVEAARAGEQGRGFAVVATEVRNLAQRSAAAARDIKVLIAGSVRRVEAGSQLVAQAGESVTGIVRQVSSVAELIEQISRAGSEQSSGIDQVSRAVAVLDGMTQHNAALVEESAAAAESLKHQAAHLDTVVQVFKVSPSAA